jgi:hypothetical protein
MRCFVLWCGPISARTLPADLFPPGSHVLTVNEGDGGIGSSAFARLGERYGSLETLARAHRLELGDFDRVIIASFSAGWGLVEKLLQDDPTLPDVLLAADSYYTGSGLGRKPGYAALCERAARGEALAVLSCSTIAGPGYPSSDAGLEALLAPLELEPLPDPPLPYSTTLPRPEETLGRASLLWLRYGTRLEHAQHATRLAPELVRALVTPYLEGRAPPGASPPLGPFVVALVIVAALAAAVL